MKEDLKRKSEESILRVCSLQHDLWIKQNANEHLEAFKN